MEDNNKRYLTIKSYAEKCGVGVHAIYMRIKKSDDGDYSADHESYLEVTELEEADGVFIDTDQFPPKTIKKGRKFKTN